MKKEPLSETVNRWKARWLKRVMYDSPASPVEKCLAYAISDHLNCVTLDCWPSQPTLMRLLGRSSARTVQRAARGLVRHGLIKIRPNRGSRSSLRYAPVLSFAKRDKTVADTGQNCLDAPDTSVRESFLGIHSKSSSTAPADEELNKLPARASSYRRAERGAIELQLAEALGPDGLGILSRLSSIDDAVVERLCRAYAGKSLGERELSAARLAAEQFR